MPPINDGTASDFGHYEPRLIDLITFRVRVTGLLLILALELAYFAPELIAGWLS